MQIIRIRTVQQIIEATYSNSRVTQLLQRGFVYDNEILENAYVQYLCTSPASYLQRQRLLLIYYRV
jgi:hypothetical protein